MRNKLKDEIKENYEPTADEIIKYGILLGLTFPDDEDLLYIARKSLKDPLPHPWKRCKTLNGDIYYFNFETGQRDPQHPRNCHYKLWVRDAKCLKGGGKIKPKTKSLLNYQISSTNDFNSKPKEIENALNIETLKNKTAEILSRPNNPNMEMDFRVTYKKYRNNSNHRDLPLMQAYQDYLQAYQQKTSLYIFHWNIHKQETKLEIYNTETETKEYKILRTPEKLDYGTYITLLPNGKLFCLGDNSSAITLLIDVNGGIEVLPSGTLCSHSSCIYFNNSVYCFGGKYYDAFTQSNKFDLDRKRWIQLTPMPEADWMCSSIILNGNILISGYLNRNFLLYSIDIDSFSIISCEFAECCRKILINAERLYVIEDNGGSIYESEIGSYTNWRRIGLSAIKCEAIQVYCSYNKGGIYISCYVLALGSNNVHYYKFDLNKKLISELINDIY